VDAAQRRLLGLETDADKVVTISIRHWEAMRLALWRSKVAWDAVEPQALLLLEQCAHVDGCPGAKDRFAPCGPHCPDRERRLSALVILAAARQFAPVQARKPEAAYIAPSREHFSEVLAELTVVRAELDALRAQGHTVTPSPNGDTPPQLKESSE